MESESQSKEKRSVRAIKRAVLSVYDKSGILELAQNLAQRGVELISSGGTQNLLENNQIKTRKVCDLTHFPEILEGRVKTLHHKLFGGILAKDSPEHNQQLQEHEIDRIDLVVVNLYPFEATIEKENCTLDEAIEKIDIGGPSLIRAAAKNYHYTVVITSPEQYTALIAELDRNQGKTSLEFRHKCAVTAFQNVGRYNTIISEYLARMFDGEQSYPNEFTLQGRKIQDLRYGENPHQNAAFYVSEGKKPLREFEKLHGKELSYNNILDLDAALAMVCEFEEPATVIIKHNNPCGAALADSLFESYGKALATDSLSAFGGIVGFNRAVDEHVAQKLSQHFFECIIAPKFERSALDILIEKKNLRLILYNTQRNFKPKYQLRTVTGGFLVQSVDDLIKDIIQGDIVTKRTPTQEEWRTLAFAWRLVKHVHSNAIIFTKGNQLIGVGAGQMSRVDAAELAIKKAKNARHELMGSVVASDAFFPFRDGIDVIAQAGATAIIQPGGSIRDQEVIDAANENNLSMVLTGVRHFKH
jgi:phosphoribosylaminoimidazolecarboxamide formyltransferase/IMP cyclohydrolase